mmetsp:Transcript_17606/g.31008  ORF Transcript_17606/g.31008 Transcript_17606/m.31008 type:complete len:207 (-) Transcript_17606:198-818(-)
MIKGLSPLGAVGLMASLNPRIARPWEVVVRQNDKGESMYFVSSGAVRVTMGEEENGPYLGTLRSGNQFGEIAILKGKRRTATCRTVQFTELFEFHKLDFDWLCFNHPVFKKMMQHLAKQRLAVTKSMVEAEKLQAKLGMGGGGGGHAAHSAAGGPQRAQPGLHGHYAPQPGAAGQGAHPGQQPQGQMYQQHFGGAGGSDGHGGWGR